MPASKIQDESEIIHWLEQGKSYQWMSDEYLRKYNIETTMTMFSNFRRRRGLDRRNTRDTDLIPWKVLPEHRFQAPITYLRREARRRAGGNLSEELARGLDTWIANLKADGKVVHYEPDLPEVGGFVYVDARPGIDNDLIREPDVTRRGGTVEVAAHR